MKKITLLYLLMLMVQILSAQTYSDKRSNKVFYSASPNEDLGIGFSFQVDTFKRVSYHNPIGNQQFTNLVFLEGVNSINLFCHIHPDSLALYRYSIIEDDGIERVIDATPQQQHYNKKFNHVDLGSFNIYNSKLTIVYYKVTDRTKQGKIIIFNKELKPAKIKYVFPTYSYKGSSGIYRTSLANFSSLNIDKHSGGLLISIENTELDFLFSLSLIEKKTGKIVFTSNNWEYGSISPSTPNIAIPIGVIAKNKEYYISIAPKSLFPRYSKPLSVKPAFFYFNTVGENLYSKKQLLIYGLIFFAVCGAIFGAAVTYIKKKQAIKLARQAEQKELAQLQLNSVRSQLNPHFLFNALAGIQNLMNKNDTDNANRYLSKFARLTRNVLDSKELISLAEEKTLLDDYLQMEQLRFGFTYSIQASPDPDMENIEIPAMLLQPFVENAVKHGIADLGKTGTINILFEKQAENLILKITDNGKGFDALQTFHGLGLALSKKRISLLNTLHRETPLVLDIQSGLNGTVVSVTLTQWL